MNQNSVIAAQVVAVCLKLNSVKGKLEIKNQLTVSEKGKPLFY